MPKFRAESKRILKTTIDTQEVGHEVVLAALQLILQAGESATEAGAVRRLLYLGASAYLGNRVERDVKHRKFAVGQKRRHGKRSPEPEKSKQMARTTRSLVKVSDPEPAKARDPVMLDMARAAWPNSRPMHELADWLATRQEQIGTDEVTYTIADLSREISYTRETVRLSLRLLEALQLIRLPGGTRGGVAIVTDGLATAAEGIRTIRDTGLNLQMQLGRSAL